MPSPDLTARVAATIRSHEPYFEGAGVMAEAIAADLADLLAAERARAALAERARIVAEVRAMAEQIRKESYTPVAGIALGSIVDDVADRINTLPDPNSEDAS